MTRWVLSLRHKLWDEGETHLAITPGMRDSVRKAMQLPNSLRRGKGQEEECFLGKKTLLHSVKWLIWGPGQALKDEDHIPGRRTQLRGPGSLRKGPHEHAELSAVRQVHAPKGKDRVKGRSIALNC